MTMGVGVGAQGWEGKSGRQCFGALSRLPAREDLLGTMEAPQLKLHIAFKHLLSFQGTAFPCSCYIILLGCVNWPVMLNCSYFTRLIYGGWTGEVHPKDGDVGDSGSLLLSRG